MFFMSVRKIIASIALVVSHNALTESSPFTSLRATKIKATLDLSIPSLHLVVSFPFKNISYQDPLCGIHPTADEQATECIAKNDLASSCADVAQVVSTLCNEALLHTPKNELYGKAAESALFKSRQSGICPDFSTLNQTIKFCIENSAIVPPLDEDHPEEDLGIFYDKYFLTLQSGFSWPQLSMSMQGHYIQKIYEKIESENEGMKNTIANYTKWAEVASPFHERKDSKNFLGETFQANVTSIILGEGMHQTIQHDIKIFFENQTDYYGPKTSNSIEKDRDFFSDGQSIPYAGFIIVLYPIPKYAFIDLDDPSPSGENFGCHYIAQPQSTSSHSQLCQVEMIAPTDRIINIEDPSFASPQNLVALNVSFEKYDDGNLLSFPIHIQFFSEIHFRYQDPINKFVDVIITLPFPHSGSLVDGHNNVIHKFEYNDEIIGSSRVKKICAGNHSEFWLVILLTGAASVIGVYVSMIHILRFNS